MRYITGLPDFNTFLTTTQLVNDIDANALDNDTKIATISALLDFFATKDELSALEILINGLP